MQKLHQQALVPKKTFSVIDMTTGGKIMRHVLRDTLAGVSGANCGFRVHSYGLSLDGVKPGTLPVWYEKNFAALWATLTNEFERTGGVDGEWDSAGSIHGGLHFETRELKIEYRDENFTFLAVKTVERGNRYTSTTFEFLKLFTVKQHFTGTKSIRSMDLLGWYNQYWQLEGVRAAA